MSHKKILIVDDDADTLLGYNVLLKAHHYDTVLAGDGVSAIREALEHQPDLMILDLGLPVADGLSVLEWFRGDTHLSAIPIIVVSARDYHVNMGLALKQGAKAYMQKPWNDDEMLALIGRLLDPPELNCNDSLSIPVLSLE
jgi:two-component system KDP operon response regulator KdpE